MDELINSLEKNVKYLKMKYSADDPVLLLLKRRLAHLRSRKRKIPNQDVAVMQGLKEQSILSERAQYRDPNFLRTLLIGLCVACPLDRKTDKCFVRAQRSLPFDDKVNWAQSLTEKNVSDLYSFHQKCFHSTPDHALVTDTFRSFQASGQ